MSRSLINVSEEVNTGAETACNEFHAALHKLRNQREFCDVTILDDGHQATHAHSVVLASGSDVLKRTLTLKQSQAMISKKGLTLKIGGLRIEVWERLLEFLYLRRINIALTKQPVKELYEAARLLGIRTLVGALEDMVRSLDLEVDLRAGEEDSSAINITLAPTQLSNNTDFSNQVSVDEIKTAVDFMDDEYSYVTGSQEAKTLVKKDLPKMKHRIKREVLDEDYGEEEDASLLEEGEVNPYPPRSRVGRPRTAAYYARPIAQIFCDYCGKRFHRRFQLISHLSQGQCPELDGEVPDMPRRKRRTWDIRELDEITYEKENSGGLEPQWGLYETPPPLKKPTRGRTTGVSDKTLICLKTSCGAKFNSFQELTEHHRQCIMAATSYRIEDYFTIAEDGSMVYSDPFYDPSNPKAIESPSAKLALLIAPETGRPLSQPMYNCDHCDTMMAQDRMKIHLAIVHGKRKQIHCGACKAKYAYYDGFRDHYAEKHGLKNTFQCPDCPETFTKKLHLGRHRLIVHRNNNEAVYECRCCGKRYKESSLARRCEINHQPVEMRRKYLCDLCDKAFSAKSEMLKHRRTHSEEKVFQCSQCDFVSVHKFHVVLHERTHGVQRGNHVCINCGKYYVSEARFNAHLKQTGHQGAHVDSLKDGKDAESLLQKLDTAEHGPKIQIADVTGYEEEHAMMAD